MSGITSPRRLGIYGRSNGGVLMTPHVSAASGRATGVIEGFDALCELIEKRLGTFEAIAISSVVDFAIVRNVL